MRLIAPITGMILLLGACSTDQRLMNLDSGSDGPDEFAILPTRALELPPDLNVLPAPTPGGTNLTDPAPMGDAVAALGGNPGQLAQQGIGAADGALVTYAGRGGVAPTIRQDLAEADAAFRARNGRRVLETLARTPVYQRAYRDYSLDAQAENERWQRAGAQTPTAPPPRDE